MIEDLINKICEYGSLPKGSFNDILSLSSVRVPSSELELSYEETEILFNELRAEAWFHLRYPTNGVYMVLYNLQKNNVVISNKFIEDNYENITNINYAIIFHAQTVDEKIKIYLTIGWNI